MRLTGWIGIASGAAVIALSAGYTVIGWRPGIDASSPPAPSELDPDLVAKGEVLAGVGACDVCHTAEGGEPFAGGRALETPFGTLHSTNITPEEDTGIGSWSLAAFERSMREGVDRSGRHLYPVFPYTHFARVTGEDMQAIYAFLMSQDPVEAAPVSNELRFPANVRPLLAGWKLLFHDAEPFVPDPERSDLWNRGAYLAEGLGHCSICHSPLGRFGAVVEDERYAGGSAEGWHGPALNAASPAPIPWGDLAMVNYLLDGWDMDHGVAAGPMQPVVNHLGVITEDDAFALAEYFVSLQGEPEEGAREAAIAFAEGRQLGGGEGMIPELSEQAQRGATVFQDVCANCHRAASDTVPLGLTSTVNMPDPRNVIHIVVYGIEAPENSPTKSMRAFGNTVDDEGLADLLVFMREQFTEQPPWSEIDDAIAEVRDGR
jgi:mono/diheme cytochrome c family protein